MANKKLERKKMMEELTRKDILKSAVSIVQESGAGQLTMDHVAAGAGIAKGTVYLYFSSKQELIDSVIEFSFSPLKEYQTKVIASDNDPIWKLEECLRSSLVHVEKNKPLLRGLRNFMFTNLKQFLTDPNSWYWEISRLFAKALDQGVQTGRLKEMNVNKVACLFLDIINSLTSQRILLEVTESIEEEVSEVMELFTNGIVVK